MAERVARESHGKLLAILAVGDHGIAAAEDALALAFAAAHAATATFRLGKSAPEYTQVTRTEHPPKCPGCDLPKSSDRTA